MSVLSLHLTNNLYEINYLKILNFSETKSTELFTESILLKHKQSI